MSELSTTIERSDMEDFKLINDDEEARIVGGQTASCDSSCLTDCLQKVVDIGWTIILKKLMSMVL